MMARSIEPDGMTAKTQSLSQVDERRGDAATETDRLQGVDRMRGLVIVLMALDHVRLFLHTQAFRFSPTDLTQTYPALFFTRFVTHYCAPTFALLAGVGAFLHLAKTKDHAVTARFLLTRGLWLIFLDAALVSPVFTQQPGKIALGTLWAIGGGLIALAPLSYLPPRAVLAFGAVVLATHDLFDGVHAEALGAWAPLWRLLHEPGPLPWGVEGRVAYPLLPWIGVVALGFGLGPGFLTDAERRARNFTAAGLAALLLFAVLRAGNFYGDPRPWSAQPSATLTVLSFLNVSKYPPSLLYALVTLGPALMLLPRLDRLRGRLGAILADFGRTPLFFYVLHLYLALAAALMVDSLRAGAFPRSIAALAQAAQSGSHGVDLAGVYLAWLALVAALYPACRGFARLKRRRSDWWLSYL